MELPVPRLSIVIPAYNESQHIGPTLEAITAYLAQHAVDAEILVVDDGSTDDTASIVAQFAQGRAAVRLLAHEGNRGKGHAVRRGVLAARGDIVLFCDADGSTPIEEAPKLLALLDAGQTDVAIGSRELPGSELVRPQPWFRRAMGWVFRNLVRLLVIRGFRDTQCGFKAFRRDAAHDVFGRQSIDRFGFDVEVLFIARRLGYRITEVPVRWQDCRDSKVRPVLDSLRMLGDLFRIRFRALRGRYDGSPQPSPAPAEPTAPNHQAEPPCHDAARRTSSPSWRS